MVRTRNQLKKELAGTNSEEHLSKQWDALFKVVRQRIAHVMSHKSRVLYASEIQCFRNCISQLTLLKHPILLDKSKDLFAFVGSICAYRQSGKSSTATAPSAPIELLEVFIKEVVAHPTLRCLLDRSTQRIPEASGAPSIRELMLRHLYLSFPKQICPNFTDSFCRSLTMSTALHNGVSEVGLGLGLDSTLALLNTSFSSPVPYLLQAHLAVLASRCIETQNPGNVLGLGFDRAIGAFELSAKLYWRSLCDLDLGQRCNLDLGQRLRPYLSRDAKKPLNCDPDCRMDEMIGLSGPNRSNEVAQKNLFLCISSYIDETQQMMHESTKFQTGDTLKDIVSILLADEVLVTKQEAGCNISEELVSAAALARLMASSLFRAVSEVRTRNARAQKAGKRGKHLELEGQLMGSLELESNAGRCLVGRKADQMVRKILHPAINAGSTVSRKRSVLMLQHFMKLMLVGLRARADFLWKACVLVMSAIMNLMAFEGEEFDALKILAGDAHKPVETTKGLNHKRKSTAEQLDASVLPNTKRQRVDDDTVNGEGSSQSKDDKCEERNSKLSANLSEDLVDFFEHPPDDLVDFLDCSPDMDLPFWLKEREGLFKERRAAQKKKRKMLRKLLGIRL